VLTVIQIVLTLQDESPVCGIPYMKLISLATIMGGGVLMDLSGFMVALEGGEQPVAANNAAANNVAANNVAANKEAFISEELLEDRDSLGRALRVIRAPVSHEQ
jgi:hypothetical protein